MASRRMFFGSKTVEPRQAREFVLESIGEFVNVITVRADHFEGQAQRMRERAKKFAEYSKPTAKDFLKRLKDLEARVAKGRAIRDTLETLQAQIPESISDHDAAEIIKDAAAIIKDAGHLLEQALSSMGAENWSSEIDDNELEGELAQLAEESDDGE